jgi:hypothetical protein
MKRHEYYGFKSEEQLEAHIKRYYPKPFTDMSVAHNAHLWQDIYTLGKELFAPDLIGDKFYFRNGLALAAALTTRFGKDYDIDELDRLLAIGYRFENGAYVFERNDFYKEVTE